MMSCDRPEERHSARHAVGSELGTRRKVAEEQRLLDRVVVGVLLTERVGIDPQALHRKVLGSPPLRGFDAPFGPEDLTAQGALEVLDGRHGHGVDHLLVELGIAFRRRGPLVARKYGSFKSTGS